MRIYRQIIKTRKAAAHGLAVLFFCMVLGMGTVCFAEEPGTVVVQSAKIRASADAGSEQLGSVQQGGTVSIVSETTGTDGKTWYEVYVDANTKGYIRSDLVKKNSTESTDSSTTAATTTTNLPATQATAIDPKSGTVITNNVRIRQGASTEYGVVATANRGMVVTVNGEAAGGDGKNWYQISFTYNNKEITGFIRADLVTFDELPADAAETQIEGEGTDTPETEPQTETTAETANEEQSATEQSAEGEQQGQTSASQQMILMNVDETPYIMPGFSPIILKWEGQDINAFKNGDFFIFYAQSQSGDEGWYVFDSVNNVYQKYVYAQENITIPEDDGNSGNIVPIIILVIIIIILVLVIGLMFVKQHDGMLGFVRNDDLDESDDEDFEDIDELDEEENEEQPPVRRVTQPVDNGQVRRPQGQVRRPAERSLSGREPHKMSDSNDNIDSQPRRYSEPGQQLHGNVNRTDGAMPRRRPQGQQPVRRPRPETMPDGENIANNGARRREERPQGENRRPQGQPQAKRPIPQQRPNRKPQQSPKPQQRPKPTVEQDDDDMDFIDI